MVLLRVFLLLVPIILFFSCSKISYLATQGLGQLSLLHNAKPNEDILNDVRIKKSDKEKVKLVGVYKKYFYTFWNKKETQIYTKTTILDQEAVTYLVTASKHDYITAYRVSFPFMGSFPYLGFFDKNSAIEYQEDLEKKDYVTYLRPVYAYSTLGYFTDTILSSFFKYDHYELAELVFHELFHTIFFIKDEIAINENLANYFAVKMREAYFNESNSLIKEKKESGQKYKKLKKEIYLLVKKLNKSYASRKNLSKIDSKILLNTFLEKDFYPKVKRVCTKLDINMAKCYPLRQKWNNARFVAFLTYEQDVNNLEEMQARLKLNMKDFYHYIEKLYIKFKKSSSKKTFRSELFNI